MAYRTRGIRKTLPKVAAIVTLLAAAGPAAAQTVTIDTSNAGRRQTIDGFGTCLSGDSGQQSWFQSLYFDDLRASMLRIDITPVFKAPVSDFTYNSPWFHNSPALPGPDGNNVRTYTNATDYKKQWAGRSAPIAVMTADIDKNVALFDYDLVKTHGVMAALGLSKQGNLGDFKLFASMWSPAPWVKLSSGNTYKGSSGILPKDGTPWPFIWGGNFAGGKLDVSGTPRAEFDDGTGPTSALTQWARGLAAYLRGFQDTYKVKFYAISIQNELNFEEYYNSMTYPQAPAYITALKAARAELDKYPDLAPIRIMGPEDLMGGDGYSMWQFGGGNAVTHKNLQYLAEIAKDPDAAKAISYFCIHGYDNNGVSSAGASPQSWEYWVNGWQKAPAAGLPDDVKGISAYQKKSWMTETSGEAVDWLSPANGFPGEGAFSIALKIHQALTTGQESGWAYWQLADGKPTAAETLTDQMTAANSPKYNAVKHYFHDIRPNAVRVEATVAGASSLFASAFLHDADGTLTVVLVNADPQAVSASLEVPSAPSGITSFDAHSSSADSYWQASMIDASGGKAAVSVPGYGVVTLVGHGVPAPMPDGGSGGPGSGAGGGASGSGGGGSGSNSGGKSGCGCWVGGGSDEGAWAMGALAAAAILCARRRSGSRGADIASRAQGG